MGAFSHCPAWCERQGPHSITLAAIFDRLGHPTLADALRRCTRVVVAEVEAAVGERR